MTRVNVRWRTKHKGLPPRAIKLQILGWAGHDTDHEDGLYPRFYTDTTGTPLAECRPHSLRVLAVDLLRHAQVLVISRKPNYDLTSMTWRVPCFPSIDR